MIGLALAAVLAAGHHSRPVPHVPTIEGLPVCVATRWAERHYHARETSRGAYCAIRIRTAGLPVSRGFAGATFDAFPHAWYPASWETLGTSTDPEGRPVGLLVRRPR